MTRTLPSCRAFRASSFWVLGLLIGTFAASALLAGEEGGKSEYFDPNEWGAASWMPLAARSPTHANADAEAKDEAGMKPYTETIPGADIKFDMVPIPGGKFTMGSPEGEAKRKEDEGPQVEVEIAPFWMAKCEVTWDAYDTWSLKLDVQRRKLKREAESKEVTNWDMLVDAMARPTNAYSDMTFGMGHDGYPAICMTDYAAKMYCKWLTANTGRYYRLPTEAEWEYACRAGTKTAYSFGDGPDDLDDYAWYFDNSDDQYQKVGQKKPNPWGLHDMHGNVCEWVLDLYTPDGYKEYAGKTLNNPYKIPTTLYPRCVRGGSWDDDADALRSAARRGSEKEWKMQDPQIPQSIWYFTDADFVGFRVVRPLDEPSWDDPEEVKRFAELYEPDPVIMKEYKEAQGGKE